MALEKSAHEKDKTISTLITGRKLLDAGYTATFKSHTQATQDLDNIRIQLYYTQHELDASKVHIMIQDEDLDELKNDIKVRNETILGLESKLQAQDEVHFQQQQWSYSWPPNPPLYYPPGFPPFFPTPKSLAPRIPPYSTPLGNATTRSEPNYS